MKIQKNNNFATKGRLQLLIFNVLRGSGIASIPLFLLCSLSPLRHNLVFGAGCKNTTKPNHV